MPFTTEIIFTGIFHFKKTKNKRICEISQCQTDLHVSSGAPNDDFLQNTFKTVLRPQF